MGAVRPLAVRSLHAAFGAEVLGAMHHRESFTAAERRFMKQLSTQCEAPPQAAA